MGLAEYFCCLAKMQDLLYLNICSGIIFFQSSIASRFMTSLQVRLGFSSSAIGNIIGVMRLLTSFISPMVSSYADNHQMHRRLVIVKTILRSVPLVFMWLLISQDALDLTMYWILNACIAFSSIGLSPMIDALFLASLLDKSTYGRVRLWGALTYGLGNLFIGCLIDVFDSFTPMFSISIFLLCFTIPMIYWVLPESAGRVTQKQASTPVTFAAIKTILTGSSSRLIFYIMCVCLGASMSLVESLLFVAMERTMKGSSPIIAGLSVLISVLFEVPIFHMAPSLLKTYGTKKMIVVAALAWMIRAAGYALSDEAWLALVLEILHGVTYGLFYTAAVEVCVEQCPPGFEATMQSLLDMTFNGFGIALGTIAGGYMLDSLGTSGTFLSFIVVLATVTATFWIVFHETAPIDPSSIELETITMDPPSTKHESIPVE